MNNFKFSRRSLKRLEGVDKDLVEICHAALKLSNVDFGIAEGLRSFERQKELYRQGLTQTLNSKHLDDPSTPEVDSRAVDVYAYVNGKASYDVKYYVEIAEAFRQAAIVLDHKIRWGGCWKILNYEKSAKDAYITYVNSKSKPFVDAMHFEIIKD